ncbi:MAG: RpiB/LacA/LacB family sugar-phosphate isomerase [Ruminococcus sp.]|nr:RpiB/LacA/LacB family sugar-phosphate isomerase [Ruminococcus sp.]
MKIFISGDYMAEELKNKVSEYLTSLNYEVEDIKRVSDGVDDYTDYAFKVGELVRNTKDSLGILICDTGIGMCIAANKVDGIRCFRASTIEDAFTARDREGINVLALGAGVTKDFELVKEIINTFINTPYPSLERRIRRIDKITAYEENRGK